MESSIEAPEFSAPLLRSATDVRLYRLADVLQRIPISKSSWFDGVKSGKYPKGYRLGARVTVWRSDDIDRLIERFTSLNPFSALLPK
jgi:prophage regulatory protein